MSQLVYLSLGSNLGDRAGNIRRAITELAALGTVTAVSNLYETEPVEFTDQPWFLNCAAAVSTTLSPHQFLQGMLSIEQKMGRRRTQPKGPRIIDLDILLFGNEVVNTPELTIPHPAMHQRSFVLVPLAEIAPDARHPLLLKTVSELLRDVPAGGPIVRKASTSRLTQETGNQGTS